MFFFSDTINLSNNELFYPTDKTLKKTKLKYENNRYATGNTRTIIQKKFCLQISEYKSNFPNVKDYKFDFIQTNNYFPYYDNKDKDKDKYFPFSDLFINNKLPNIFYDENIHYIRIFFSENKAIVKDNKLMIVDSNYAEYMGLYNYVVPNNIETFVIKTQRKINQKLGDGHYMETIDPFDLGNCINLKYLIIWVENFSSNEEPISLILNTQSKIPFGTKILLIIQSYSVCIINEIITDFIDTKIKCIFDPKKIFIPEGTVDKQYFEFEHLDMKNFRHLGLE
jgi:hypothetical protein